MRAQARLLLSRLQGFCVNADAALAGAQHSADQTCTDQCNSSLLQHPVRSATAPLAAADSLLWTSTGIHSLRPAIAAALSQPLATGDAQITDLHGAAWCTARYI